MTPRMKTPTHGILKSGDTASAKKRSRVMFAPDKPTDEEDGTDSDSSTSQLMEIEVGIKQIYTRVNIHALNINPFLLQNFM